MKTALLTLLLLLTIPVTSQQNSRWYVFGGLSSHIKNVDVVVNDGLGWTLGLGVEYSTKFGLEFSFSSAPGFDTYEFWDEVQHEYYQEYDLENFLTVIPRIVRDDLIRSFTIAGTREISLGNNTSWLFKAGYSYVDLNYDRFDVWVLEEYQTRDTPAKSFTIDLRKDYGIKGHGLFLSGGILIDTSKNAQFEISLSQTSLEEGGSPSLNGSWRYKF